ncbi:hypothetical protein L1049_005543 [Liquidambar formosana]|uniref:Uncharacterized protein n=1 Tax=Liquidambar formosana TaxID=63359 RepID=A0AAP0RDT6_LIQFO
MTKFTPALGLEVNELTPTLGSGMIKFVPTPGPEVTEFVSTLGPKIRLDETYYVGLLVNRFDHSLTNFDLQSFQPGLALTVQAIGSSSEFLFTSFESGHRNSNSVMVFDIHSLTPVMGNWAL